jgi:nitrate reductase gamma subunit
MSPIIAFYAGLCAGLIITAALALLLARHFTPPIQRPRERREDNAARALAAAITAAGTAARGDRA